MALIPSSPHAHPYAHFHAHPHPRYTNLTSLAMHGVNLVFMLLEFALDALHLDPRHFGQPSPSLASSPSPALSPSPSLASSPSPSPFAFALRTHAGLVLAWGMLYALFNGLQAYWTHDTVYFFMDFTIAKAPAVTLTLNLILSPQPSPTPFSLRA